jgi:hypothetical protein
MKQSNEDDLSVDRYPGLRPFVKEDEVIFFGRNVEVNELLQSIKVNSIFLLFGKSGLGKSSLVNAGVVPKLLETNYRPIVVRFYNTAESPLTTIGIQIKAFLPAEALRDLPLQHNNSLRDLFNVWDSPRQPILIFDQFEEFFYYDQPTREATILELAALTVNPASGKVRPQLIFLIRSDRLNGMSEVAERLPGLLNNRYQLPPLRRDKAEQAIVLPAQLSRTCKANSAFSSEPFDYSLAALRVILNTLTGRKDGEISDKDEVESSQLQILCQELAEIAGRKPHPADGSEIIIEESDFGGEAGLKKILNEFYRKQLDKLKVDPELQLTSKDVLIIRSIIEDQLVSGNKRVIQSADRVRQLVADVRPDTERIGDKDKKDAVIDKLLSLRLIREEDSHLGKLYEISHDTLLDSIIDMRNQRMKMEHDLALEVKEKQLTKERSRVRLQRYFLAALFALLIAIGVFLYYFAREEAHVRSQKNQIQRYYAETLLFGAGKAIAADNQALAWDLAQLADSLLSRNGNMLDSCFRQWTKTVSLKEYSGSVAYNEDNTVFACQYRDGFLQVFHVIDTIRARNPYILFRNVASSALSEDGSMLAITDTISKVIKVYRLWTSNTGFSAGLLRAIHYRVLDNPLSLSVGNNYLAYKGNSDSLVFYLGADTTARRFYTGGLQYGYSIVASDHYLYLRSWGSQSHVVKVIDIDQGTIRALPGARLLSNYMNENLPNYLYDSAAGLISRLDSDKLTPIVNTKDIIGKKNIPYEFLQTDSVFTLATYFNNPRQRAYASELTWWIIRRIPHSPGSSPLPTLTPMTSMAIKAAGIIRYSPDTLRFINESGDSLLTLGNNGNWLSEPIDSLQGQYGLNETGFSLSKDRSGIFAYGSVANSGFIPLHRKPLKMVRIAGIRSYWLKLENWDLFEYGNSIFSPFPEKKDTTYWNQYFEKMSDMYKKVYGSVE